MTQFDCPQTNLSTVTTAGGVIAKPTVIFVDNEYLDSLCHDRRENPPKTMRCKQWVDMYPELESTIHINIREKETELESAKIEQNVLFNSINGFEVDDLVKEMKLMNVNIKIDRLSRELRWLGLGVIGSELNKNMLTEDQIQQARDFPMEDLLETQKIRKMWCCPFHDEKTPSFSVFKENSWHCFGCQAHGGNAIDYVMKKNNLGFVEAVKFLIGGLR